MIRRPPRSTLFPYTTPSDLAASARLPEPTDALHAGIGRQRGPDAAERLGLDAEKARDALQPRSEEHTSELQSLAYLVCRLLLEKKNKTHSPHTHLFLTVLT